MNVGVVGYLGVVGGYAEPGGVMSEFRQIPLAHSVVKTSFEVDFSENGEILPPVLARGVRGSSHIVGVSFHTC